MQQDILVPIGPSSVLVQNLTTEEGPIGAERLVVNTINLEPCGLCAFLPLSICGKESLFYCAYCVLGWDYQALYIPELNACFACLCPA